MAYQYDLAGRQTRITWPDAFYAAYEYDVAGALIAVRENGAMSGAGVLALYTYDNLGRRASLTRGNGVVTTYAYDNASRLDVLTHNLSGTASDVSLDFAHNAAGQILSRDRSSANGAYVYPQPGMNVDAYASNGLNQIASLDGASLSYDARGNLTSAGGVAYTYDAFNRLTAAGPLALVYDPAGRLYETTASGSTTRFLYAGTFSAQAGATGFTNRTAKSDKGAASGLYLASYYLGGLAGAPVLGVPSQSFVRLRAWRRRRACAGRPVGAGTAARNSHTQGAHECARLREGTRS